VSPECKCRRVGPPPTNLGVRGFGELTLGMAECEGLALVTLAKTRKNDQINKGELARVVTQTICVTPKELVVEVTTQNWPILKDEKLYIIDRQHSVMAAKTLLEDQSWKNPLKETIRYRKAFVVHSNDSNQLIVISTFMNQKNEVRQFEASWVANIVTRRTLWMEHDCLPKKRKNTVIKNPKWQIIYSYKFTNARP
jgi:hypothetical protein